MIFFLQIFFAMFLMRIFFMKFQNSKNKNSDNLGHFLLLGSGRTELIKTVESIKAERLSNQLSFVENGN